MRAALATLLLLGACGTSGPGPTVESGQPAQLATLRYDGPLDWTHVESRSLRGMTATWLPETNARKEALIVSRAELEPGRPELTGAALQDLLVAAQKELPDVRIAKTEPFTTAQGLHGVRVEADFIPTGLTARYHRLHAVLLDGHSLVHVLYTAKDFAGEGAFNLVVNTVHGEV